MSGSKGKTAGPHGPRPVVPAGSRVSLVAQEPSRRGSRKPVPLGPVWVPKFYSLDSSSTLSGVTRPLPSDSGAQPVPGRVGHRVQSPGGPTAQQRPSLQPSYTSQMNCQLL